MRNSDCGTGRCDRFALRSRKCVAAVSGVFFWLACLTSLGPFFHPQSVRGDFTFTNWSVCLI